MSKKKKADKIRDMIKTKYVVGAIIAVVVLLAVIGYINKPDYTNFAKCLSENNATMYGAYWCGHCKQQKKDFGDAFQYVSYVECTTEKDLCDAAGVEGFPTWVINGQKVVGRVPMENLARLTGCSIG